MYRYLVDDESGEQISNKSNVRNFKKLLSCLKDILEFTDGQMNTIWRILAAVLNIGELRFSDEDDGETKADDVELIAKSKY